MEDVSIIELYWARSQDAIVRTKEKYGRLIYSICIRILRIAEDALECENDTYLKAWDSMPPNRPDHLSAYLGRIARNLSLDRYEREHAMKRGGSQIPLILEELEECIPASLDSGLPLELRDLLNRFLEGQTERARILFVRRYWFGDSVKEIAERYALGESLVKMTLLRSRNALRAFLEREGISI
ncbi:MAG TPA: RNA polymerase subunit sigma-70 [Lachnospiraceae bacterium]|nr:RNA polymerase subunit sigma-70 [Lachnospiraceae bacterium]